MHWLNLKSIALPVPETIMIAVLGGVANPQSWEEEAIQAWGWYHSKELW